MFELISFKFIIINWIVRLLGIRHGILRMYARIAEAGFVRFGLYAEIFTVRRLAFFNVITFRTLVLVNAMFHSILTLIFLYLLHIQNHYFQVYSLLDRIRSKVPEF